MAKVPVTVELVGTDGNIFALIGKVSREMKKQGYVEEAKQMTQEVTSSGSYDEALQILMKWVEVE